MAEGDEKPQPQKTAPSRSRLKPQARSGARSGARPGAKSQSKSSRPPAEKRVEQVFDGIAVSPGVGTGTARVRESGIAEIPSYTLKKSEVDAELKRLSEASKRAARRLKRLRNRSSTLPAELNRDLDAILDAQAAMLRDSRLIRGAEARIRDDLQNAETAVSEESRAIEAAFRSIEDAYLAARADDVHEVSSRVLRALVGSRTKAVGRVPKGSVVIAETLTPADAAQLDPDRIVGFATHLGASEGHTAIMARALGIPAVMGVAGMMEAVRSGRKVIIDGTMGRVIVNPTKETLARYRRRHDEDIKAERRLARFKDLPAVSRDQVSVTLMANVELPVELDMVSRAGAEGIGLMRSEFLFMNRDTLPTEDEQYEAIKTMVLALDGKPATVRTVDIGGEKPAGALFEGVDPQSATALGLRGIRLSLAKTAIFEDQMRAILRASVHGPVRILLPMVTTVGEVRRARTVLDKAWRSLKRKKVPLPDKQPPLGVMIEVPGAALAADALTRVADFFAIGSNDLTMYTLAVDRGNEHVAKLFDTRHPAVLRLIQFSTEAALRANLPVSICGEVAGDPAYTALLVGLGLRELSMTAAAIPRVKQRIRELDVGAATQRARLIMDQTDSGRIAALLDDFNQGI